MSGHGAADIPMQFEIVKTPIVMDKKAINSSRKKMKLTPDIQYLINPALNPNEDASRVLGLRGILVF